MSEGIHKTLDKNGREMWWKVDAEGKRKRVSHSCAPRKVYMAVEVHPHFGPTYYLTTYEENFDPEVWKAIKSLNGTNIDEIDSELQNMFPSIESGDAWDKVFYKSLEAGEEIDPVTIHGILTFRINEY